MARYKANIKLSVLPKLLISIEEFLQLFTFSSSPRSGTSSGAFFSLGEKKPNGPSRLFGKEATGLSNQEKQLDVLELKPDKWATKQKEAQQPLESSPVSQPKSYKSYFSPRNSYPAHSLNYTPRDPSPLLQLQSKGFRRFLVLKQDVELDPLAGRGWPSNPFKSIEIDSDNQFEKVFKEKGHSFLLTIPEEHQVITVPCFLGLDPFLRTLRQGCLQTLYAGRRCKLMINNPISLIASYHFDSKIYKKGDSRSRPLSGPLAPKPDQKNQGLGLNNIGVRKEGVKSFLGKLSDKEIGKGRPSHSLLIETPFNSKEKRSPFEKRKMFFKAEVPYGNQRSVTPRHRKGLEILSVKELVTLNRTKPFEKVTRQEWLFKATALREKVQMSNRGTNLYKIVKNPDAVVLLDQSFNSANTSYSCTLGSLFTFQGCHVSKSPNQFSLVLQKHKLVLFCPKTCCFETPSSSHSNQNLFQSCLLGREFFALRSDLLKKEGLIHEVNIRNKKAENERYRLANKELRLGKMRNERGVELQVLGLKNPDQTRKCKKKELQSKTGERMQHFGEVKFGENGKVSSLQSSSFFELGKRFLCKTSFAKLILKSGWVVANNDITSSSELCDVSYQIGKPLFHNILFNQHRVFLDALSFVTEPDILSSCLSSDEKIKRTVNKTFSPFSDTGSFSLAEKPKRLQRTVLYSSKVPYEQKRPGEKRKGFA